MTRSTIDFGIDLGTTNSAISVLRGTAVEIIKNNLDNDITPSAVYIDKRGQIQVGQRAKNRLEDEKAANDVYIEFKKRMGSDFSYEFKTADRRMRPEELSAEVLKSLRGDVQQRIGEDLDACVITIPAAFEAKQQAATRRAGELAGFTQCPLLQEPVAAALAYGFQADVKREYWLVYDFGGGTFDAALVKAEDGTIVVVNHGGDNYLGGSNIDWEIIERLLIPELTSNYNFPDFWRGNKRWTTVLGVLKRSVEVAKVQLSRDKSVFLEDCRLTDADGEVVEFEFKLTQQALATISEPIIMRSVEICNKVLREKKLPATAVEKLILVGGPTLAPYFREALESNLGIPMDLSCDPLTAVARGAAIFAGTQRLEKSSLPVAAAGEFNLDLKYNPVGTDEDPTVRGEVIPATKTELEGFTIEFVNDRTQWRSGKVTLKADGKFKLNLLASKGGQNVFSVELYDPQGRKQIVVPENLTYTIGTVVDEQPITNSIAIALATNEADVFFRKGDGLPARAKRSYRVTHPLTRGQSGDVLTVPVVEGEIEKADRNRLLGNLVIKGTDVPRDVPVGSDLEVTLFMDASGILRAKGYIPLLDEEYEAVINFNEHCPNPEELDLAYRKELDRLGQLRKKASESNDAQALTLLNAAANVSELERLVKGAGSDPDVANMAEKRLLEFKVQLDAAEDALLWPTLVDSAYEALGYMDEIISSYGNDDERSRAQGLRSQVEDLIQSRLMNPLQKKVEQVESLAAKVLLAQPSFWIGAFEDTIQHSSDMSDQPRANRLIEQGNQCVTSGNIEGLKSIVRQLGDLLPRDVPKPTQRGYRSSVIK